jgi:hypothetical protein
MPVMDGFEFCKQLRGKSKFSEIPFIFLTAHGEKDNRLKGLKVGADDYIVKPFEIEELIARIEVILKRAKRTKEQKGLSGSLSELTLPDVLQVLEQSSKSGRLNIYSNNDHGYITFKDGMIMDASCGKDSGEDALVKLFRLQEGTFTYQSEDVKDGQIKRPMGFMMMEIARLYDEMKVLEDILPAETDTFILKTPSKAEDPDTEKIIGALKEGKKTFQDLLESTGFSKIRLKIGLGKLKKTGAIDTEVSIPILKRPLKILFLCELESSIENIKKLLSEAYGVELLERKAMVDILPVRTEYGMLNLIFFKGTKQFAPLWEGFLPDADLVVCILADEGEHEWVNSVRQKRADKGFYTVKDIQSVQSLKVFIEELLKAATS